MEIRPGTGGKYRLRDYAQTAGWKSPTESDGKTTHYGYCKADGSPWLKVSGEAALAGWPTTRATDFKTGRAPLTEDGQLERVNLVSVAEVAGWPTPVATEQGKTFGRGEGGANWKLNGLADLAGWRTPQATDWQGTETPEQVVARRGGVQRLMVQSQLAGWRSPQAADTHGVKPEPYEGGRNSV